MSSRPAALAGLTILDLTRLLPGAFASQMLADMGAEVIKVEDPRGGDYNRPGPLWPRRNPGPSCCSTATRRA
jgi:crotonobetainyl-CoA:carnitine CoA-transferase CaiB-like acyl-CoA transferase